MHAPFDASQLHTPRKGVKLPLIVESKDGCAPDTVAADLLLWLRTLRLSSIANKATKSVTNWRRAFSSGFLFAEIINATIGRMPGSSAVEMHSFQPRVSSEEKKIDNWRLLLPLLRKRLGIKLKIDSMEVLRVVRARKGAAMWLLERIYRALIVRNIAPETPRIKRGGTIPPAPVPPGTTDQNTTSPLKKNRIKSRLNSYSCKPQERMKVKIKSRVPESKIGTPGTVFRQDGKIMADDATKVYANPQDTAVAIGKVPL